MLITSKISDEPLSPFFKNSLKLESIKLAKIPNILEQYLELQSAPNYNLNHLDLTGCVVEIGKIVNIIQRFACLKTLILDSALEFTSSGLVNLL